MLLTRFPLSFHHCVLIDLRVAALVDGVIRRADQRRDFPDALVWLRFVAFEWMTLHVADERMQQNEAGALLDAAQNGVARRARQARPAIETWDDHHLKRRVAGQVTLDVAIDSLE